MTEDEMVGCHHPLNGHEFEQALGDREGQGRPACCSLWGRRVGHDLATKQLTQGGLCSLHHLSPLQPELKSHEGRN